MNPDLVGSVAFLALATGAVLRPLRPTTAQAIRRFRDSGNAWLTERVYPFDERTSS